jgi:hypothetical protein
MTSLGSLGGLVGEGIARARAAKEIKAKRATLRGENMIEVSRESKTKGERATQAWGKNKPVLGHFIRSEIHPAIVLGATRSG